MRNVFDQFRHPENRLTHALMCALNEDRNLLKKFLRWSIGQRAPTGDLTVLEQTLPGEEQDGDFEEPKDGIHQRGLPDGWIHDESESWALLIESKIGARLTQSQLLRHRSTAIRRGFKTVHVLAFVVEAPTGPPPDNVHIKLWSELYSWLKPQEPSSEWVQRLTAYMTVLEGRLMKDGTLRSGTLTVFTGIPFGKDHRYNYLEAKVVLRAAMEGLSQRPDIRREFGIPRDAVGRGSITGSASSGVWDYLPLVKTPIHESFTSYPHLTIGIHTDFVHTLLIVPNGVKAKYRTSLLNGGQKSFIDVLCEINAELNKSLGTLNGVAPIIEIVQRRYPNMRSEPFLDAHLEFDLRTAFPDLRHGSKPPKYQPQWLQASYDALSKKMGNLQLAVGAKFEYDRCPAIRTEAILEHIAATWIACKPLIVKMGLLKNSK
jgi:hypothetical protein